MNYLKKCMYNKIAAYFNEHNNATSEEIWDKVFNYSGSIKMVEKIHQRVIEDSIDNILNGMSK